MPLTFEGGYMVYIQDKRR